MKKKDIFIDEKGVISTKTRYIYTPNFKESYLNKKASESDDVVFISKSLFEKYKQKVDSTIIKTHNSFGEEVIRDPEEFITVSYLIKKLCKIEMNDFCSSVFVENSLEDFIKENLQEILSRDVDIDSAYGSCFIYEVHNNLIDLLNEKGYCKFYVDGWSTDAENSSAFIKEFNTRKEACEFIKKHGEDLCSKYFSKLIKLGLLDSCEEPMSVSMQKSFINCSYNGSSIECGLSTRYYFIDK